LLLRKRRKDEDEAEHARLLIKKQIEESKKLEKLNINAELDTDAPMPLYPPIVLNTNKTGITKDTSLPSAPPSLYTEVLSKLVLSSASASGDHTVTGVEPITASSTNIITSSTLLPSLPSVDYSLSINGINSLVSFRLLILRAISLTLSRTIPCLLAALLSLQENARFVFGYET
jgi:hypothetical protein